MSGKHGQKSHTKPRYNGKKPGAGRPKGATNKVTLANIEAAMAGGKMPLDVMLEQMRRYDANAEKLRKGKNEGQAQELDKIAAERARDAAPYLHHKLQTTNHTGTIDIRSLTDEQLDLARKFAATIQSPKG